MERPCDRSGRLGSFGRARSTAFAVMSAAGLGLLCLAGAHPAGAAVTGTGGGPESTVTAPHTSSSGQTLPPGAAGAPILDPDKRTERQRKLDRVLNGICKGC